MIFGSLFEGLWATYLQCVFQTGNKANLVKTEKQIIKVYELAHIQASSYVTPWIAPGVRAKTRLRLGFDDDEDYGTKYQKQRQTHALKSLAVSLKSPRRRREQE